VKKHQKSILGIILLVVSVVVLVVATAEAEAVLTDIYSGYTGCLEGQNCWGGAPYDGYVGSITSSDVLFATNTGYNWHPFGLISFGALVTGTLSVASAGSLQFTLDSDDGSMLYIDGSLVVNNGYYRGHPPNRESNSVSLLAGIHPFSIEFFEDFGGPSGVDLYLPPGVTYAPVPIPGAVWLLGSGLMGLVAIRRRFRK